MSETITHATIENYKGTLQQYCQKRALGNPVYDAVHQGTPNEPRWKITVKYGQTICTTPEPIRGSKRFAEHIAAKQILESIETHQEAFLAGEELNEIAMPEEPVGTVTETKSAEPLYVPTEFVTTALGIANHRLAELRSGTRYRDSQESKQGDQAFAQDLANLTLQIVREVVNAVGATNVKFGEGLLEARINEQVLEQTDE